MLSTLSSRNTNSSIFSLPPLLEDYLYHLVPLPVILLVHHHLNDHHCPNNIHIYCRQHDHINHLQHSVQPLCPHLASPFQLALPSKWPPNQDTHCLSHPPPVYLTLLLHHLTVQHLLDCHWQYNYICWNASQCNELFSYAVNMKTHMIDDRSQSRKSHICRCRDECKKILRYGHLRTHLLIYSEEKPHPCGPCEVSCREAESLNKHILHHSGENPHSCTECKKVFW